MATYTLDWSESDLGGSAVVSYDRGAILDFTDKPAGATAALSLTPNRGDSINVTIAEFTIEKLSGTSVMTFDYHTSSESGLDKLHVDVNGVSQADFSGATAWTSHSGINIGGAAGTRTIRFRYQKDSSGIVGDDRVWVALLNITNTVTTNDDSGTVDSFDMEDAAIPSAVTTSSWTNSTSEPIAGTRSLRSPASPADDGSYDLEVTKAATSSYRPVSFKWKVSSEAGWDRLFVFPDPDAANVPASGPPSTAGNPGWLAFSGTDSGRLAAILPAAESSFLLRYSKDSSSAAGSDAAWIDDLELPASGSTNANVDAVTATATAAAPAPVVSTSSNVVATLALATALALIPVVSGESVVSGGGPATASAQAVAPSVAAIQNPTVASVVATATSTALAPTVSASGAANVAATTATASAAAAAPVVEGVQNPTVVGVAATATATAPAPSVVGTGGGGANVAGIAATATAQALTPSFSGSSAVTATLATSTAAVVAPTVTGGATVTATTATATATAPTPVGLGIQNANLAAIVAGATAAAIAPAVQGITGTPVTPASRTITVPAENRVIVVPAENRTMEA